MTGKLAVRALIKLASQKEGPMIIPLAELPFLRSISVRSALRVQPFITVGRSLCVKPLRVIHPTYSAQYQSYPVC